MNKSAREAWNNRPMEVRVFDRCPCCDELREHVKVRKIPSRSWYSPPADINSCEPCWEEAKQAAREIDNATAC